MSKESTLAYVTDIWDSALKNDVYLEWRKEALEDFGFYDGTKQWLPEDLRTLAERGQIPLTFNFIQSMIDNLCGLEVQTRYRMACRVDSDDPNARLFSKALSHYGFIFQEKEKVPHIDSYKFRDTLVCGLAWSCVYKEDKTCIEYVNPFHVIPDMFDSSPQMTNQRYVCRKWWVDSDRAVFLFPWLKKKYTHKPFKSSYSSPFGFESSFVDHSGLYGDYFLISEVQYKVPSYAYTAFSRSGRLFCTFDESVATRFARDKKEIEETKADKIQRVLFIEDKVLSDEQLKGSTPAQKDFSYTPNIWKREITTGRPYGLVDSLKSIQLDLNARMVDALFSIKSQKTIIQGPLPYGKDEASIKKELRDRNALLVLPHDTKVTTSSSIPLGEEQIKFVNTYLNFMNRVSGIQDEMLGVQTNATSGLAQQIRQTNSVRSHIFAFDQLEQMKEREMRLVFQIFQGSFLENVYVPILDEDEEGALLLNVTLEDEKGNKVIEKHVDFLPFHLYLEEVKNFRGANEEQKEDLMAILNNPNAALLMQSETLVSALLGVRNGKKIVEEFAKIKQEQDQARQQQPQLNQGVMQ